VVSRYPDPAELYPEVAAAGSLAAALQAAAVAQGLEIGHPIADEKQPLYYATIASRTPLRKPLSVHAGAVRRSWGVEGWGQGIFLVSGRSDDLAQVARAARLWAEGAALAEIVRAAPFVRLNHLSLAAEQGPEQVVAAQWQYTLEEARTHGWPEHEALVEAAHAERKFRQLYPYTSHWTLRFSTTTGYPYSPDYVALDSWPGKPYVIKANWREGPVLGETATAEEAIRLAVRYLPSGIGPAVTGQYPR